MQLRLELPQSQQIDIDFYSGAPTGVVTVCMAGFLANADMALAPVREVFTTRGDVTVASWRDQLFTEETVKAAAQVIAQQFARYEVVVINATSDSGVVAYDTLTRISPRHRARARLLPIDAPTGLHDIAFPVTWLMEEVSAIMPPRMARVLNDVTRNVRERAKPGDIESHLDVQQVQEKTMKMLSSYGQIFASSASRYARQHPPFAAGALADVRSAYILCTRDNTTVRQPDAYYNWQKVCPSITVFAMETKHAASMERPNEFMRVCNNALDELLADR